MLRAQELQAAGVPPPPVLPLMDLLGVAVPASGDLGGARQEALGWLQGLPYAPATNFLSMAAEQAMAGEGVACGAACGAAPRQAIRHTPPMHAHFHPSPHW